MWAVSDLWHTIVGDEEDSSNNISNNTSNDTEPPKPPLSSTPILPPAPPKLSEWKSWQSPTYAPKLQLSTSEKRSIGKRLVRGVQTWYENLLTHSVAPKEVLIRILTLKHRYGMYRKKLLFDAFDTKRKGYVTAMDVLDNVERFNLVKSRRDFVGRLREAGVTKEMRLKFRSFVSFAETHLSPLISKQKRKSFWEQVSFRAGDVQLALQKVDQDEGVLSFCMGPSRRNFIIKYPISRELKSGTGSQLRFEAFESESMRRMCNEMNEFLSHRTYSTRESALVVALDEIALLYAKTFSVEDRALRYVVSLTHSNNTNTHCFNTQVQTTSWWRSYLNSKIK